MPAVIFALIAEDALANALADIRTTARMRSNESTLRRRKQERGFSLIEVLIAFVILSMAMAALLPALSGGLVSARTVSAQTVARLKLESLLAEFGAATPLHVGDQSGVDQDGYSWKLEIQPYDGLGGAALIDGATDELATDSPGRSITRALKITATVTWGAGDKARSWSLTTVRLGPAEGA